MCDLTKEFKLCSCDGETLTFDQIGWLLRRKDKNKPIELIMGKPAINILNKQQKNIKTSIAERLNNSNCFDFEYQPQEDDFLKIRIPKSEHDWYAYRFVNGLWMEDDSHQFEDWRKQLEEYKNGKVVQKK